MVRKPLFYEAACLFSMIGSGIGFLSMCLATFFFDEVTEKIRQVTNITATEKLTPVYFALLMAAYSVSLTGVIRLYRLKRSGLYFYLSSQLLILFIPVIWLGWNGFSATNAIFTSVFAGVYLFNYRIMEY
jgi:hypothetical protein